MKSNKQELTKSKRNRYESVSDGQVRKTTQLISTNESLLMIRDISVGT